MFPCRRIGQRVLVACGALLTSGCLSLCGKTTYVQESPETPARLSALESRVSALEQAVYRDGAAASLPIGTP